MKLTLPALLRSMIADGRWGTAGEGDDARISAETARRWDPSATGVHLLSTPVSLASDLVASPDLTDLWNVADVDSYRCVVIGDFGLGSDNPIILDFSFEPPAVRTLRWSDQSETRPTWMTVAPTFETFVAELGIT